MNKESKEKRAEWTKTFNESRSKLILGLLREVKGGMDVVGAQIGVWSGDFLWYLLGKDSCIKKIYAIDPFDVYTVHGKNVRGWERKQWDNFYQKVKVKLSVFGDRVELIRKRSDECVELLPILDFVQIDGDHSCTQVSKDIASYEEKIVKGGLLCGDNYHGKKQFIEGVREAVNEYARKYGRHLETDQDSWMWWWRVP